MANTHARTGLAFLAGVAVGGLGLQVGHRTGTAAPGETRPQERTLDDGDSTVDRALSMAAKRRPAAPPRFVFEPTPAAEPAAALEAETTRNQRLGCATSLSQDCPFLQTSPEALRQMARCGAIKVDLPILSADSYDVAEAERPALAAAIEEFQTTTRARLASLHLGPDGQVRPGQDLTRDLLMLEAELDPDESDRVLREIAQERAGLKPAPTSDGGSPIEIYWRLKSGLGDAFERAVASGLGRERARALRQKDDGWAAKSYRGGECRDG
jgi:hypothetical protein